MKPYWLLTSLVQPKPHTWEKLMQSISIETLPNHAFIDYILLYLCSEIDQTMDMTIFQLNIL